MINKNTKNGFTLIETLIAVFVLMLAISGPLTLAAKGLQATLIAKDQDGAFYLAQDAIEYVRWVRDTNRLRNNADWLAGLDGASNGHTNSGGAGGNCTAVGGCTIDSLKDTTATCASTCPVLNYDTNNNYFTYTPVGSGVNASIFTRTVILTQPIGSNDCSAGHGCEAKVSVTVSWYDQGSLRRSITVNENLLNWQ